MLWILQEIAKLRDHRCRLTSCAPEEAALIARGIDEGTKFGLVRDSRGHQVCCTGAGIVERSQRPNTRVGLLA